MTKFRRISWAVTILYWGVIFIATHLPPKDVHIPPGSDKQIHFIAYFLLSSLLGMSLLISRPSRKWVPLFVVAVAMVYGAFDELTQPIMDRSCDIHDWYADVTGASTAAVLLFVITYFVARSPARAKLGA